MSVSKDQFFALSPEAVLGCAEALGLAVTGRCLALNSYENRVYEVELDTTERSSQRYRILKFYRPGRWTYEQIREEHDFLFQLREAEIPVIAPERGSLRADPETGIHYCSFPKQGGRIPDEWTEDSLGRAGRMLARIHQVGLQGAFKHRLSLSPEAWIDPAVQVLRDSGLILAPYEAGFLRVADVCRERILHRWSAVSGALRPQRIHGDCHRGNWIENAQGLFMVDFDDACTGPVVQDLWLLASEPQWLEWFLNGYEQMSDFPREQLGLVESLRTMRMIYHAGWIAKRWDDPVFPHVFPQFQTEKYWRELVEHLREQTALL